MPLTANQRRLVESFLDGRQTRFRRSDIATKIYGALSPRSQARATQLAAEALRTFAREGRIVREGHLHWNVVQRHRTLVNGQEVPERDYAISLALTTRVPEKWVAVDLETGESWRGTPAGSWVRADAVAVAAVAQILGKPGRKA